MAACARGEATAHAGAFAFATRDAVWALAKVLQLLIERGADPEMADKHGKRAVDFITEDKVRNYLKDAVDAAAAAPYVLK